MIIGLYNNSYSRDILLDFTQDKSKILINIGLSKEVDSEYCGYYKKGLIYQILLLKKISKLVTKKTILILPNRDNIISNILVKKFSKNKIYAVAEGTRNYYVRNFNFKNILKNFSKFIFCSFFFEIYNPFFVDNLEGVTRNKGKLLVRKSKLTKYIKTKSLKQDVVSNKKIKFKQHNILLAIGSRIPKNLPQNEIKIDIKHIASNYDKCIYLKHPNSNFRISDETYFKRDFKISNNNNGALESILKIQPSAIISIGGSSVIFELHEKKLPVKSYIVGLDLLQKKDTLYADLKILFRKINVTILS